MCGLAGVLVSKRRNVPALNKYTDQIDKILTDQTYRGPDFQRIECIESENQYLIMGHNRLSIVDLNPNSHQPMSDETGRFHIIYNGMLYNYIELHNQLKDLGYTFFSEGDTEVVLKAFMNWGTEAFSLFNGMFAIAIYDKIDEKLYLVRDRFGIKPLFYFYHDHILYFASTSNELARQLQLQPNMSYLARGLAYWVYDSESETVYQDLKMVSPSEVIIFDLQKTLQVVSKKYYSLSNRVNELISNQTDESIQNIIDKTEYLLTDAVNMRLRADVPLAVSLSGGIDSATIASLAKKNLSSISAFSFGSLYDPSSEAVRTKATAKNAGLSVHFVAASAPEMQQAFWQTLKLQDAPFPNFSIPAQYLVFNHARQQGIKVMLGGQGGDEIFMGYRKYLFFYLARLFRDKKYLSALSFSTYLIPSILQEATKIKSHLFNIKRYSNKITNSRWQTVIPNINLKASSSEPMWVRQIQDLYTLSLPTLLRYEDRNSMGNSIESRLPFLDYRLVELALSLPETMKLHHGYGKWVLRKISQSYIPENISFSRQKRGFDVDSKAWINSGIGESLRVSLKSNVALLKKMNLENKIDSIFSDHQLSTNHFILSECITLVWLAEKKHFIWS